MTLSKMFVKFSSYFVKSKNRLTKVNKNIYGNLHTKNAKSSGCYHKLWEIVNALVAGVPTELNIQMSASTPPRPPLTHWGRVTHICVSKLIMIGSDNGLSPDRRQAIIWTNAGLLLIGPLGTNVSDILIEILEFSFKKMLQRGPMVIIIETKGSLQLLPNISVATLWAYGTMNEIHPIESDVPPNAN